MKPGTCTSFTIRLLYVNHCTDILFKLKNFYLVIIHPFSFSFTRILMPHVSKGHLPVIITS